MGERRRERKPGREGVCLLGAGADLKEAWGRPYGEAEMEQSLEGEEGAAVSSLGKRVRQWEWPVQRPKVGGQEQQEAQEVA